MNILLLLAHSTLLLSPPDWISNTHHELSQFMSNPLPIHWTAAKCALRYIKGTLNLGITYLPLNLDPHSYSDANWGTNLTDRRSVSGYTIMFGDGAISWYSKK